jgi:DNA repair protein RadA/Sms
MKTRTTFVCQECGYDTPKFLGKCPECGEWNTLREIRNPKSEIRNGQGRITNEGNIGAQELGKIAFKERLQIQTNFSEMNTVLGGGLVLGSVTLIAGDPGVGKSTLLLQLTLSLAGYGTADNKSGLKVLYISGEESVEQIKMRADRLEGTKGIKKTKGTKETERWMKNVLLLATSDPDYAIAQVESVKPDLVILDSVQTMQSANLEGLAGAVGQVRYTALQFIRLAKQHSIPIIIVGHVTKEGMVAGPMILAHMVDTVLFLEGEKFTKTRILRSLKNRFGPIDEVGIFMMEEDGMREVLHPEQLFLTEGLERAPGSVLVATLEGTRAFIVEVQALAIYSKLIMPRRIVSGLDKARVELLLAVLQKHAKIATDTMDVFVNVAGGMKLTDPAADLGICLSVFSSLNNIPLFNTVAIAEVGLQGELRTVTGLSKRIREAEKLGYKNIITAETHKNIGEVIETLQKKILNSKP